MTGAAGAPAGADTAVGAAPAWRRALAATWWDLRSVLGNGEQLLVVLVIPVAILTATARTGTPDLSPVPRAAGALAAAVAVAVVSSAFTGQAIALAFDRRAGLVRFLVSSPLGRAGILAGRAGATVALVALQLIVLVTVAALLGIAPGAAAVVSLAVVALAGAAAFASLGLLLGGAVRAEGVLALANIVWLLMLALGGLVVPVSRLPGAAIVRFTPPGLLGEAARTATVSGRLDAVAVLLLLAWAGAAAALASRTLRWS